jgi:hypothetical protein
MTDRRFTEDQFAEILRRATEMQARVPARLPGPGEAEGAAPEGMSLAEISAIASEVGIDPEFVHRAASLVVDDSGVEGGLAPRWVLEGSSDGQLTEEDKVRLVRAIRDATGSHGDSDMAGAGLEWKYQSGDGAVFLVTAEPFDGRTELRVSVDASVPAVGSQLFSMLAGGLLGAAIGTGLGAGLVGGIALVAGGAGMGFGVGRLMWKRIRSNVAARSRKLLAAAASALPGR